MTSFICLICHVRAQLSNRYFDSIIIFKQLSYKKDRSGKRKFETASEEEG